MQSPAFYQFKYGCTSAALNQFRRIPTFREWYLLLNYHVKMKISWKEGGIVFAIANIALEKLTMEGEVTYGSILHEMQGKD